MTGRLTRTLFILATLCVVLSRSVIAADPPATLPTSDNQAERLVARYSRMLETLRAEIARTTPTVDEHKKANLQSAAAAVRKATAELNAAQQPLPHWQADKAAGLQALAERQAALDAPRRWK